ncbi:MAG: hypothetical protein NXI10_13240 [bacterium]|nr:hypothetical protein [bacterium]
MSLSISIPQNSGLAFVDYKRFEIHNDTLYVIDRTFHISLDDSIKGNNYKSDTSSFYILDKSELTELRKLLGGIDSLGHHSADGCVIQMGWPRFFIHATFEGKEMNGFIANCYREDIYKLVDFMNKCYPKGQIIKYDKAELIEQEKKCNEYDYGRGDKK